MPALRLQMNLTTLRMIYYDVLNRLQTRWQHAATVFVRVCTRKRVVFLRGKLLIWCKCKSCLQVKGRSGHVCSRLPRPSPATARYEWVRVWVCVWVCSFCSGKLSKPTAYCKLKCAASEQGDLPRRGVIAVFVASSKQTCSVHAATRQAESCLAACLSACL